MFEDILFLLWWRWWLLLLYEDCVRLYIVEKSNNFRSNTVWSTFTKNRAPPDTNSNQRPMTAAHWLVRWAASYAVSLARRLLGKLPTQTKENTSWLCESMPCISRRGYDVTVLSPCCQGQKSKQNKRQRCLLTTLSLTGLPSTSYPFLSVFGYE